MIEDLVQAKPGAAEAFLHTLQHKLARHKAEKQFQHQHHQQHQHYHPHPHHQHPHQPLGGSGGGFSVGTCLIDGEEEALVDSSDPHVPAHQHAFHLHPHPPASSPSAASAFAAAGGPSSPCRPQFLHSEGEAAAHSPLDMMPAPAAPAPPVPSLQVGPATARRVGGVGGAGASEAVRREVDEEILLEKEETIQELRETVELLELKLAKLEQLLRLKDGKIERLGEELARLALRGGEVEAGAEEAGDGVGGYNEH